MTESAAIQFADGVDEAILVELVGELAREVRLSGSAEEARTFDFVERELRDLGYEVAREQFTSLVGYPIRARVEVLAPETFEIAANGYSLSPSTPPEGIVGELLDVGAGAEADYAGREAGGWIVLADGLGMPSKQVAADRAGAAAVIHINGERIHEMCLSPVWGTPTPTTAAQLPKAPSVAILGEDGKRLRQLMAQGPVIVRVETETYRDWRPIPVLTADLAGTSEDTFVLFSGHVDSWHYGAVDNATANAVQLGVARLLAERRDALRRGVRIAFWSGHSHARYAGSMWYVDHHWDELEARCVAHVNIDSVGAIGATVLTEAPTMAESYDLAARVLRDTLGEELEYRRITRAGDQSLWGLGVPSLFITLSEQALSGSATEKAQAQLLGAGRRAGGVGWFWHTPDDTFDKVDPAHLARDARVYAATLWELCTSEVLPFSFAAGVREILGYVRQYGVESAGHLDVSRVLVAGNELVQVLDRLEAVASADPVTYNTVALELAHILIPINYTAAGRFEVDPGLSTPPVPGLADASRLSELDPAGGDYHYLLAALLRQRNRVMSAFRAATRTAALGLAQIEAKRPSARA